MSNGNKLYNNQMLIKEIVTLNGQELVIDLTIIDMLDFDIILDIDFLKKYRVETYCKKKKSSIQLRQWGQGGQVLFQKSRVFNFMINSVKAKKILSKGYTRYLAHIENKTNEVVPGVKDTLVV